MMLLQTLDETEQFLPVGHGGDAKRRIILKCQAKQLLHVQNTTGSEFAVIFFQGNFA